MSGYLHDRPMERVEALGYAKTFAGQMEELERKAAISGDPGLMAQADQVSAHMRELRDEALRRLL